MALLLVFAAALAFPTLVAVCGLLIAVASVVVGHGPQSCLGVSGCGSWALGTDSVAVMHRLSCSAAWIFLDQGLVLCPLHWAGRFLSTCTTRKVQDNSLYVITHTFALTLASQTKAKHSIVRICQKDILCID